MHKIIPINCINDCIICYNKTLNINCCNQCKVCIICKNCLKKEINSCPTCRKEDFRKKKFKIKCPFINQFKIKCPFIKKIGLFILWLILCFFLGTSFRFLSNDFSFDLLDIWLNIVLGIFLMGIFMLIGFCFNWCKIKHDQHTL